MDVDKAEELQRSIDAVLAKIEERKRVLGSLLSEARAVTVLGWAGRPEASVKRSNDPLLLRRRA